MITISNHDNVIDSRDVIERIEELESIQAELVQQLSDGLISEADMLIFDKEQGKELDMLRALADECIDLAADWEYGETLIRRDHFEKYMDEMVDDCYEIPKNLPYWMSITLDYDALEQDYASVDFDGQEYLIRNC